MNIPSSNTGVRAASERLPVVTGQALARLDQELSQGQFPQDVFLQKDAEGAELALISQPRPGAVALDGKRSAVKNARTATFGRSLVGAPLFLAPGAMLGYVGMPGYPLVGAAVGAGVGLAMLYDVINRDRGEVEVNSSVGEGTRTWWGTPENYEKTPQEQHLILNASGALGDRVVPVQNYIPPGGSDPQLLRELDSHKERLKALGSERRLLADLGGKTRYGQPALQLIDAGAARELMSRGQSVHLIDCDEVSEVVKRFQSESHSGTHDKKAVESYSYTESSFSYRLQELRTPTDLHEAGDGKGLPENFLGVPRDSNRFSKNTRFGQAKADRVREGKDDKTTESHSQTVIGPGEIKKDSALLNSIRSMTDPSTRGYAIAGGVLGMCAGLAVPGVDPACAATLGGVAGHFVGRVSVAKAARNKESAPVLKKVLAGAGAMAGVGLGVMAAAQSGNVGMVAASTVAGLGGASAGLWLMRGKPHAAEAALGGFALGGALGIANSFIGPSLPATIALGALGASLGGTVGYLMADRKPGV